MLTTLVLLVVNLKMLSWGAHGGIVPVLSWKSIIINIFKDGQVNKETVFLYKVRKLNLNHILCQAVLLLTVLLVFLLLLFYSHIFLNHLVSVYKVVGSTRPKVYSFSISTQVEALQSH
jgi:hypothetical protein